MKSVQGKVKQTLHDTHCYGCMLPQSNTESCMCVYVYECEQERQRCTMIYASHVLQDEFIIKRDLICPNAFL